MFGLPPIAAMWLTSLALLAIGYLAHIRITTTDRNTGLGFIRYTGILCGTVGVLGIPLTGVINPYLADISTAESAVIFAATIVIAIGLSHIGWKTLGPEPRATQ